MKRGPIWILLIIILFIIVTDFYTFKGIRLLLKEHGIEKGRTALFILHWLISSLFIIAFIWTSLSFPPSKNPMIFRNYFLIGGLFMLFYIPKIIFMVFHLSDDIIHGIRSLIITNSGHDISQGIKITRWQFLSKAGIIIAAIPFLTILYGMLFGKSNLRVREANIAFPSLPPSFNGLKIVQISDTHLGSFGNNRDVVEKAVKIINQQQADLVFFTGDLVNHFAEELDGWQEIFKSIKAKTGKYAVLGNHDYGDYYPWDSQEEKENNAQLIRDFLKETGFSLLCNASAAIEKGNDKLALIGVENWGEPPFKQYGDINKAMEDTLSIPFKILLSHNPSHWDSEILQYKDIALTFSGHTHGMQVGIEKGKIKWSPAKYRYPRWGGLYEEKGQYLYVNRGLGFIGFPGRIGMPPEVTILNLTKD